MPPLENIPAHPPSLLDRIERHPYFAVSLIVIIVLVLGIIVVLQRVGVSGAQGGGTWTVNTSIFSGGTGTIVSNAKATPLDIIRGASPQVLLPPISLPVSLNTTKDDSFSGDLDELLSVLSPKVGTSTVGTLEMEGAFSFIPRGLISTNVPTKKRSLTGSELFTYGNDIGTYLQSFESLHTNMAQILKDQAEDRQSVEKSAALTRLSLDYAQFGYELSQIEAIPSSAKSAHLAYATANRSVGTNMKKVAEASSDEAYLSAITTYNESVEGLARSFIALTALFSLHEVTFSSSDQGNVFMFQSGTSF